MQKIRKALEKIGKEFKFKDMNALKVMKYFMLKHLKHTVGALHVTYMSLAGWFSGGVPRSGEVSHPGVYGAQQPQIHRDRPTVCSGLCQE